MDEREIAIKDVSEISLEPKRATDLDDLQRIAKIFVASKMFGDEDLAKACVKIMAGQELGLKPFEAMSGIHLIKGKPSISANLLGAMITRAGYRYHQETHTEKECTLRFFLGADDLGTSSFTIEDAAKAELLNNPMWKKYPRNMLFARALSNGARWKCASAFSGQVPYVMEELEDDGVKSWRVTTPAGISPAVQAINERLGGGEMRFFDKNGNAICFDDIWDERGIHPKAMQKIEKRWKTYPLGSDIAMLWCLNLAYLELQGLEEDVHYMSLRTFVDRLRNSWPA